MYQLRNSKICIVDYENCSEFDKCVTSIIKKLAVVINLLPLGIKVMQIKWTVVLGRYWIVSFPSDRDALLSFIRNSTLS